MHQWKSRLAEHGMRLNTRKTVYIEACLQTDGTISIDGEDLKKTNKLKYLGSAISSDVAILPDVRAWVNGTWTKWRQVTAELLNHRMPDHLKAKIYKTVVFPVALCGSESWPATSKPEQVLHTMEMQMLRWCLGLMRWDQVMNEDIRNERNETTVVRPCRARRRTRGGLSGNADRSRRPAATRRAKKEVDGLNQRRP